MGKSLHVWKYEVHKISLSDICCDPKTTLKTVNLFFKKKDFHYKLLLVNMDIVGLAKKK